MTTPIDEPKADPSSHGGPGPGASFGHSPSQAGGSHPAISREGGLEGHLGRELRRALVQKLLAESFTAELTHVVASAVAVVLAWRSVSPLVLLAWSGSVLAIAVVRGSVRRHFSKSGSSDEAILPLRIAVIASGMAWGAAALIIGPQLPFQDLMLLLVIFAGLVAGSTATLKVTVLRRALAAEGRRLRSA